MGEKILLVDDDPITHSVVKNCTGNDFEFIGCFTIEEANAYLSKYEPPSLILIDRKLPDGDGLAICQRMKSEDKLSSIPVVFLSGLGTESDKVTGLFAGADDYITKPFGSLELRARIAARLRHKNKKLHFGQLTLDVEAQRVSYSTASENQELDLTRIEYRLFQTLAQNPERILSRENLLNKVWPNSVNLSDRVVDTHISHLRKKLIPYGIKIESLRGEGYRLISQAPKSA